MTQGTVISASRRSIVLRTGNGETHSATSRTKAITAVVGDEVVFAEDKGAIEEIMPRKNLLRRSLEGKEKILVANVDHLFVVASVGALFQRDFIDRVLVESFLEGVKTTLIVNKIDLGLNETEKLIELYRSLGYRIILTSAKTKDGLDPLTDILNDPALKIVSLLGVSGVGKSTILNALIPGAEQKTQNLSEKSGQGKQTTTLAIAHRFKRDSEELLIVDLPGVQKFGLSHIELADIGKGFVEFENFAMKCQFRDCIHKEEINCEIKRKVEEGLIANSRYQTYLEIIEEKEKERQW